MALISISSLFAETFKAVVAQSTNAPQAPHVQDASSTGATVGNVIDAQPDLDALIRELRESAKDGARLYDAMRIIRQIGELGSEARPAVDLLIDLLGKQLPYCNEELTLCPDKTRNCPIERRTCPDGVEKRKSDVLSPYAFAALKQIGATALPNLSVALDDETINEENIKRCDLAARVMGSIGPAAIPFLSDKLRTHDHPRARGLALVALSEVLFKDPASGNQIANLVPYITPFLNGNFETTDQAINVLGVIGPAAAEAVPQLVALLSYQRTLPDYACTVGERTGYIFRPGALSALEKIGTPEAMRAVEQYKVGSYIQPVR